MMTLVEEFKETANEMPWFIAAVLLGVILSVGVSAKVVSGADGDRPRVSMGRVEATMVHVAGACEREVRRCASLSAPGVTMVIGVRNYWVEMTIPESAFEEKLAEVRSSLSLTRRGSSKTLRQTGSWDRA